MVLKDLLLSYLDTHKKEFATRLVAKGKLDVCKEWNELMTSLYNSISEMENVYYSTVLSAMDTYMFLMSVYLTV
jgi:hypothetical protein